MRLKTLIVPAFILCLLALAVWQTSQALPGLIFEVICHSVVLCFSYKSYRLWAGLLWAIIGALNTSVLLYEAGQIWLGAAVGISLQLWKGPQLPRARNQRTAEEPTQEEPTRLHHQTPRQARRREYHQRKEEEARIRASTPYAPPLPRPESPQAIAMRQAAADQLRREGEARQRVTEEHNARVEPELARIAELRRNGSRKRWQQ